MRPLNATEVRAAAARRLAGRVPMWGTLKKVGTPVKRNATCPCGSGQKFKKCCLPKFQGRR